MTTMTTDGQSLVRNCEAAGWTKPTGPGLDDNVKQDSRETYHDFRRGQPEGQERAGAPAVAKRWRGAGLGDGSRRRRACVAAVDRADGFFLGESQREQRQQPQRGAITRWPPVWTVLMVGDTDTDGILLLDRTENEDGRSKKKL